MRLKLALLFTATVFPTLIYFLAPDLNTNAHAEESINPNLILATPFVLDDQSTVEYWYWQRQETLPVDPVVWVMPGIGGPGAILDDESANAFIDVIRSRHVDQIVIVQLRGHSLNSELACSAELEFDECISGHLANGLDLTKYHYLQYAQDVIQLKEHLGIKQWHVWGASYGGRVATAMAMLDPSGVSSLLLDSPVSFDPADQTPEQATSSELLHKLYAACKTFKRCFENQEGSLEQLAQFIVEFETPTHRINGLDHVSIYKPDWIYSVNELMYDYSPALAVEWIFMHINHQDGFTTNDLSADLKVALSLDDATLHFGEAQTWSINYEVTLCNEDPSKNTFKVTDYGVYGQYLDYANACWPLKDWSQTHFEVPDIPVMIVHLPFDNVITMQDAESHLKYWPHAQLCIIPEVGHTMPEPIAADMIENISTNQPYLPKACHRRETAFYPLTPA